MFQNLHKFSRFENVNIFAQCPNEIHLELSFSTKALVTNITHTNFDQKKWSKSRQIDKFLTGLHCRFAGDENYKFLTAPKSELIQNLSRNSPFDRFLTVKACLTNLSKTCQKNLSNRACQKNFFSG